MSVRTCFNFSLPFSFEHLEASASVSQNVTADAGEKYVSPVSHPHFDGEPGVTGIEHVDRAPTDSSSRASCVTAGISHPRSPTSTSRTPCPRRSPEETSTASFGSTSRWTLARARGVRRPEFDPLSWSKDPDGQYPQHCQSAERRHRHNEREVSEITRPMLANAIAILTCWARNTAELTAAR